MRSKVVAANWKMNGDANSINELLTKFLNIIEEKQNKEFFYKNKVIICAPFVYLSYVKEKLKNTGIKLGAQNLYYETKGAFTGEISPLMLKDIGCEYVIVGHSERRQVFSESDDVIVKKVKACFVNGLIPIFCVGETKHERENAQTFNIIKKQLKMVVDNLNNDQINKMVIAYEPVWAIGTGLTATPTQAEEVHIFIRNELSEIFGKKISETITILYGGSVNGSNSSSLFSQANIDGALVGGASLNANEFSEICFSANNIVHG